MSCDFLLESKLRKENPALHSIYTDTVSVMSVLLDKYKGIFPKYTDHSMRHTLNVIEFANKIIGEENIVKMNSEEIFIFLLGAYLHDVGMGVSEEDFVCFIKNIDDTVTYDLNNKDELHELIRKYHHELSSEFVKKYAPLFDIENEKYIYALAETTRGHRVTDLLKNDEFPVNYLLDSGNTVCLPYLGALIRLADEIDISRERNDALMYETSDSFIARDKRHFEINKAIASVELTKDAFILTVDTGDEDLINDIRNEVKTIQYKLDVCRQAVNGRTKYTIFQKDIVIKFEH